MSDPESFKFTLICIVTLIVVQYLVPQLIELFTIPEICLGDLTGTFYVEPKEAEFEPRIWKAEIILVGGGYVFTRISEEELLKNTRL